MRSPRGAARRLASALTLAALAACGHGGGSGPSPKPAASPSGPAAPAAAGTAVPIHIETHGESGQYVTIVQSLHGRKLYTIRALSTDVQSAGTNEGTGQLDQPHVTFIDRHGATTIADAPKAHLVERDKTVVMTGGVHANTSSGSVLTCDTLTYSGATERFHGEGHVELQARDGMHLSGDRLDGDTRLQEVTVTGGAHP
ncbi:MAG TPA: LPS export ABC transporter periplasmic protein LptC [Candidatus Elarobacter sp.]|nr:LPS export ABC transporter periplasmic protein LptC [Candidatus Elarobacter sp.]